jgi:hypothetical protein
MIADPFHGGTEALARSPGDYHRAEIRHWLHSSWNSQQTSNALESVKVIKEGDAVLDRFPDQGKHILLVGCRAVAVAHSHAAHADSGNFESAGA